MRSYRSDMPEERNRVETDQLADLLCAPTQTAAERLAAEGVPGVVVTTGDVLFDMLLETRDRLPERAEEGPYVLATVHRNYNHRRPRAPGGGHAVPGSRGPVLSSSRSTRERVSGSPRQSSRFRRTSIAAVPSRTRTCWRSSAMRPRS